MKNVLIFAFMITFGTIFAQNASDLLFFNTQNQATTARSLATGGAIPGADWGVLNPAGFALLDHSQLQMTGGWRGQGVSSAYFGQQKTIVERNYATLNSIGMVFVNGGFGSHLVFGVGYSKLGDYRRSFAFEGEKEGSIISWMYQYQMDPQGPFGGPFASDADPFTARLGGETNAFFVDGDGNWYSDFLGYEDSLIYHQGIVKESGGLHEIPLTLAARIPLGWDEKSHLSWGFKFGIQSMNYKFHSDYLESDPTEKVLFFDSLRFSEARSIKANGVNLTAGLMFETSWVRLGVSGNSGSFFSNLCECRETSFMYAFTDGLGSSVKSASYKPIGGTRYRVHSAPRATASLALVSEKIGFVSGEVERVWHPTASFNLGDDAQAFREEADLNQEIDERFIAVNLYKVGGELKLGRLRVQGGMSIAENPLRNSGGATTQTYSGGVGYLWEGGSVNFAYSQGMQKTLFEPYPTAIPISLTTKNQNVVLTISFKL